MTTENDGPVVEPMPSRAEPPQGRLRRFWTYLRPFRGSIALLGGCVVITILITLPAPWLEKIIIDEALPNADLEQLFLLVAAIVGIIVVQRLVVFSRAALSVSVKQRVLTRMRMHMYEHLQRMSPAFFARHESGQLLSRITNDVSYVQNLMNDELFEVIASLIKIVVTVGLLLAISPKLTLLCAGVLPVVGLVFFVLKRRVYVQSRALQQSQAKLSARIQQNFLGMKLIQAETIEEHARGETLRASRELERVGIRRELLAHGGNLLTVVLSYGPIVAVLWGVGGYLVIQRLLTLGELLAFTQYVFGIVTPATRLFQFNMNLQAGYAALDRMYEILDEIPEIVDEPTAVELEPPVTAVAFSGVSLRYADGGEGDGAQALAGVSFEIKQGEKVAIVGPSGAGKTSVANLLLRFCDPCEGEVLINDQPLPRYQTRSLRQAIGYVAQEVFLFHATVRENVTLGRRVDDAELERALAAAAADRFVAELDGGLDADVDELGANLSGGQRQRLALARLFLKRSSLVVLDEATSALDSKLERHIWESVADVMRDETVIIIAHRFTFLDQVDRVLVLADGQLVEEGTVAELLERRGIFHALHQAQS